MILFKIQNYSINEGVPFWHASWKDSAIGTILSIKNPKDDPLTYSFKIGINQVFEHVRSLASREIGNTASSLSGPIATTADPMHC